MITVGMREVVFGIQEIKPLRYFPEGRIKIRMRPTDFANAFVKSATGIRKFLIRDTGDAWEPSYEQGRNERRESP